MAKQVFRLRELLLMQPEKWLLAWGLGAVALGAAVALLAVSGWFISAAALAGMTALAGAFTFDYFRPGAIIRALAMIRTAGRYGERLASHHAVLGLLRGLRIRLFGNLLQGARNNTVSAQAMQRLTGDIDLLDHLPLRFFLPWLWAVLLQSVFLLWLGVMAPQLAAAVALPLCGAGLLLPALATIQGKKLAREDAAQAERRRELLVEPLPMLTSLLLWQRWSGCRCDFLAADRHYGDLKRHQQRLISLYGGIQQALLALAVGLLLWHALPLLQTQDLSVTVLLAMVLALFGLNEVLSPLSAQFMAYGFAVAARDRLNDLLMPSENDLAVEPKSFQTASREITEITVTHLYAKYPNALSGPENISFKLSAGEALIISGRSGCGKSTLFDVLAGELPLRSGHLNMNDRDYDFGAVNYLAQQIDIFNMTLADNLRLGDKLLSDDDLWQVLEQVELAGWVRLQPQGLQTPLGEYGAAVSGGQARRIALARLLLRPKPVLLLDEPFAGLDAVMRNRIWKNLRQMQRDGFLIVASHHLPTDADYRILDLDGETYFRRP